MCDVLRRMRQSGYPGRMLAFLFILAKLSSTSALECSSNGPKENGLGSAYTAIASDPTALIYNPAGLGFQTTSVSLFLGGATSLGGVEPNFDTLPSAFVNLSFFHRLSLAAGAYRDKRTDYAGYLDNRVFHAGLAWRVLDKLSLGGGYIVNIPEGHYSKADWADAAISKGRVLFTYNLGVLYKPSEHINIGISGTKNAAGHEYLPTRVNTAVAWVVEGSSTEESPLNFSYLSLGWTRTFGDTGLTANWLKRFDGIDDFCLSYLVSDEGIPWNFREAGSMMASIFCNQSPTFSSEGPFRQFISEYGLGFGFGIRFSPAVSYHISAKVALSTIEEPVRVSMNLGFTFRLGKEFEHL